MTIDYFMIGLIMFVVCMMFISWFVIAEEQGGTRREESEKELERIKKLPSFRRPPPPPAPPEPQIIPPQGGSGLVDPSPVIPEGLFNQMMERQSKTRLGFLNSVTDIHRIDSLSNDTILVTESKNGIPDRYGHVYRFSEDETWEKTGKKIACGFVPDPSDWKKEFGVDSSKYEDDIKQCKGCGAVVAFEKCLYCGSFKS